jgi:hypothetical protein
MGKSEQQREHHSQHISGQQRKPSLHLSSQKRFYNDHGKTQEDLKKYEQNDFSARK